MVDQTMDHGKYFLISFLLLLPFSTSVDTITIIQPVKDGDVLVSAGETFALGFFRPTNSSLNRYVGVWYHKVSEQTVVWVANRDNPITGNSGVLSLDPNSGNLVLRDQNGSGLVWSTNANSTATTSAAAQLLDSGNLVVFGDGDRKRDVLWQSFDYPTNTMLPNMKLGLDRRTGLTRFLTSWKSPEDPGSGEYTYKIDVRGSPQFFLSKGSAPLWRTGDWNGHGWSGIHMPSGFILNPTFVDNQDEVSLMFSLKDASIFSRMIVSDAGNIQRLTWLDRDRKWFGFYTVPSEQCDNYGHCGAFGYCDPINTVRGFECTCLPGYEPESPGDWFLRDGSRGCARKPERTMCGNGEGFIKVPSVKVADTSTNITRVDRSLELKSCEELCLRNCTCMGYASADVTKTEGSGCITWHGDMIDTRQFLGGQDIYVRVDAILLAQYLKKSKGIHGIRMVAIVVSSAAAVLLILSLTCWMVMKKKRDTRGGHEQVLFSSNTATPFKASQSGKGIGESGTNTDLPFVALSTIVAATDNFSFNNKLGEGGFGSVYKGQLCNGQEIAVKRLSNSSGQGIEEFKNEVTLIAKLQHRNLVRLLGYCIQEEEKMLIYEYMPNKGLDTFIFDKEKGSLLGWSKRFEITLGIARGMLYLHQDSRLRIIHRDLKASNVLLDAAMNPKISDFGMARIFGGEQMEATTNRVVGTYGYMSPEYAMEGLFSIKSDVFSFGVLLLEIISGRKNSSFYKENSVNLIGHVWDLCKEDRALDIVDTSLGNSYQVREVMRCIHVGLLCVQEFAIDRPTMSEVAFMLGHETSLPSPKQPAFILKNANVGQDSTSASVNDVTITVVEAR